MAVSPILKTNRLKHVPKVLVFILVLLLGLPAIGIELGFDFGILGENSLNAHRYIIDHQVYGYIRQILLQWSAFSLAVVSIILALTQYRLVNDRIALIIGLSILFCASVEAAYLVIIDGISIDILKKNNLDALVWAFANTGSGLILAFGLAYIIKHRGKEKERDLDFKLLIIILALTGITFIYYTGYYIIDSPSIMNQKSLFSRPYEWLYVIVYLVIILYLYPRAYKIQPYILLDFSHFRLAI